MSAHIDEAHMGEAEDDDDQHPPPPPVAPVAPVVAPVAPVQGAWDYPLSRGEKLQRLLELYNKEIASLRRKSLVSQALTEQAGDSPCQSSRRHSLHVQEEDCTAVADTVHGADCTSPPLEPPSQEEPPSEPSPSQDEEVKDWAPSRLLPAGLLWTRPRCPAWWQLLSAEVMLLAGMLCGFSFGMCAGAGLVEVEEFSSKSFELAQPRGEDSFTGIVAGTGWARVSDVLLRQVENSSSQRRGLTQPSGGESSTGIAAGAGQARGSDVMLWQIERGSSRNLGAMQPAHGISSRCSPTGTGWMQGSDVSPWPTETCSSQGPGVSESAVTESSSEINAGVSCPRDQAAGMAEVLRADVGMGSMWSGESPVAIAIGSSLAFVLSVALG